VTTELARSLLPPYEHLAGGLPPGDGSRVMGAMEQLPDVDRAGFEQAGSPPAVRPRHWLVALRADPRRAIQEESIRCLICGGTFRQLTNTHLRKHRTLASEYKRRFGYNQGRPLMCRALQRLYAERAVNAGLADRIRTRPILVKPELRRRGGSRAITLEEFLTRREARQHARGRTRLRAEHGIVLVPATNPAPVRERLP
jgi:predicted transcriptional regulator